MKSLVLAAGDGMWMLPLITMTSKPPLMMAGRPFMDHTSEALKVSDID